MISVLIPTINAAPTIERLLKSLRTQIVPHRVYIVDSSSTDNTVELADKYDVKIVTIKAEQFDHGATRNMIARLAEGDFLVFMTQDVVCADQYTLHNLVKPLEENADVAVSFARQLPQADADAIETFARNFNYPEASILKSASDIPKLGIKTYFCSNSCAAYRRNVFEKLGGFSEGVVTNEDMLFAAGAIKAGYGIYYAAEAKVYHSHTYTLGRLFKRYYRIGKFLKDNARSLDVADKHGHEFIKAGLRYFSKKKQYWNVLRFIAQSFIKFAAFKLGYVAGVISG
ncbi:MAG: hypothetical protein A2178_00260 [Planctomycetes bacterium GWC2_49_10]|nr:MAG: hypothetical protein A2178_00260 [Planctomycetes bacterium GWC2_49_10]